MLPCELCHHTTTHQGGVTIHHIPTPSQIYPHTRTHACTQKRPPSCPIMYHKRTTQLAGFRSIPPNTHALVFFPFLTPNLSFPSSFPFTIYYALSIDLGALLYPYPRSRSGYGLVESSAYIAYSLHLTYLPIPLIPRVVTKNDVFLSVLCCVEYSILSPRPSHRTFSLSESVVALFVSKE